MITAFLFAPVVRDMEKVEDEPDIYQDAGRVVRRPVSFLLALAQFAFFIGLVLVVAALCVLIAVGFHFVTMEEITIGTRTYSAAAFYDELFYNFVGGVAVGVGVVPMFYRGAASSFYKITGMYHRQRSSL
ncbi:hypothetical protein [Polycladidibacter stylochi]|uniref:hypothetical protein n=1 Tax=Polycladidibacter stylochi TaxID=1807766 RepID=UPI0008351544|nr:hypothetical protein [Pseudovibrio stylochi]